MEKAKSVDTAQKEPSPAKSDEDATGTTLEEQTGEREKEESLVSRITRKGSWKKERFTS